MHMTLEAPSRPAAEATQTELAVRTPDYGSLVAPNPLDSMGYSSPQAEVPATQESPAGFDPNRDLLKELSYRGPDQAVNQLTAPEGTPDIAVAEQTAQNFPELAGKRRHSFWCIPGRKSRQGQRGVEEFY
jgi:hypothetical protein